MDRYQAMFARLNELNQGAFVPFVTLGDPDIETSLAIVDKMITSGADALELGIPFSDPIADGPTLQKASIRALEQKVTPSDCLNIIAQIRVNHPDTPIGLLLYSNLVMAKGIDHFYEQAAKAGVDSILIADVPVREGAPFRAAAKKHNIKQILIAPPNASEETLQAIAEHSEGYTYLLGRAGVTGTETAAEMPAGELVQRLEALNVAPPIIGFGISKPEQVKAAIAAGAAGAISGSATVKIIEQHLDDQQAMLSELGNFIADMKAATQKG
ncbi:tryptophan synthase subunit alpha [Paraneptunicella aestuarii]|uniref:tryptophan synthase subunit alpha n=1 Tax=Paraneptunicella aestuarii TaxID=2831148 RepID=UPI001E323E2D|nr:tryptophan synthase subunit alpha [Paraneptunicella aestuarii]UAA37349.1 tryptophan synthase subunit alpha [Paraneptunicella aestuarii]